METGDRVKFWLKIMVFDFEVRFLEARIAFLNEIDEEMSRDGELVEKFPIGTKGTINFRDDEVTKNALQFGLRPDSVVEILGSMVTIYGSKVLLIRWHGGRLRIAVEEFVKLP